MATQTGTVKAAKQAAADEDARLLAEQELEAAREAAREDAPEAEVRAAEVRAALESEDKPVDAGLPPDLMADLPPAVVAILAGQAQQQAALTAALEMLAEKVAGQSGVEVTLSGSAENLMRQLAGTVSDGGDGDHPLDEPVVFISKGANCKVVKTARHRSVMPDGSQTFTTGIAADFAPTGTFSTRNPEMVEYLKARPGFGAEYWVMGQEPYAAPDASPVLERIFALAMGLEDGKLGELEAEERQTHKRPEVLRALATARKQVQAFGAGT